MTTGPGTLTGSRYRLEHAVASIGDARCYDAADEKLARPVRVWLIEALEGSPEREHLLSLARTVARMPATALVRVLDVVPEAGSVAIVIEAPPSPAPRPVPGPAVAGAALDVANAVRAGRDVGLHPARLDAEFIFPHFSGPVRVDPIGVFLPDATDPPATVAWLLADVIDELVADSSDPLAERLRGLAGGWRRDAAPGPDLDAIIEQLRSVAGDGGSASLEAPPSAAPVATRIDEEDTLEMEPWPVPGPVATVPPATDAGSRPETAVAPVEPPPGRPSPAAADGSAVAEPRRGRHPALRTDVLVPAIAAVFVVILGTWGLFFADESPSEQAARGASDGELRPPVETPTGNGVTVGLAAQEDSIVRVTVDGIVEFDGVLREGQRQLWEGRQRIQVRTENGQTLLLSVNGDDLGPYSPAMGHPEWNRIDFGFWPGWEQDEVFGRGRRE